MLYVSVIIEVILFFWIFKIVFTELKRQKTIIDTHTKCIDELLKVIEKLNE
jgi:hypothetical protein